ncbi:MAG: extracellular solute-binding protein, partial [Paracoccaceae bacterium]|nr:extracellular solute-binding protein [Paracoccaceae bacterium]
MTTVLFQPMRGLAFTIGLIATAGFATAEPKHGISMYGEPALGADFTHLPYANPDAPTGGQIVTGEVGGFDSLNPYIRKGSVPWQLRFLASESLMGRSYDEPFALYGVLAETIETGPNREWVEFTLREEARFSDGSPVTVEDVMWSYETLGTQGHPRYAGLWGKIGSMEQTGERSIKFTFNVEDRELALIVGMRPILKKAQWDGLDFAESGLDVVPITTSPYVIGDFEAGRFVSLQRNPDYWGADIPFRRGTNVMDEVRLEFYADGTAQFEAFKSGEVNSNREFNAAKWDSQYDFPAIDDGDVVKSILPHERPSGITGFVMNTRNPIFADWRVRDAMIHVFNFEFINEAMTGSAQPRITSYFSNSVLSMQEGPAEGRVREFLEPFAADLLPGTLEGYDLPVSDGSERNRAGIRAAITQF